MSGPFHSALCLRDSSALWHGPELPSLLLTVSVVRLYHTYLIHVGADKHLNFLFFLCVYSE